MSKKTLTLLAVGLGLSGTVLGATTAFAAGTEGSKSIPVSYANQESVPDPDNPDGADWQVGIPTGVHFTNETNKVNVGVELQKPDYSPHDDPSLNVNVSLSSLNSYDLVKGAKKVAYKVTYNSQMNKNNTKQLIGTLTGGSSTYRIDGNAELLGRSDEVGRYNDSLTYYIQKQ